MNKYRYSTQLDTYHDRDSNKVDYDIVSHDSLKVKKVKNSSLFPEADRGIEPINKK